MKKIVCFVPLLVALSSCVEMAKVRDISSSIDIKNNKEEKVEDSKSPPLPEKEITSQDDDNSSPEDVVEAKTFENYFEIDLLRCSSPRVNESSQLIMVKIPSTLYENIKTEVRANYQNNGRIDLTGGSNIFTAALYQKIELEVSKNLIRFSDLTYNKALEHTVYAILYNISAGDEYGSVQMENYKIVFSENSNDLKVISACEGFNLSNLRYSVVEEIKTKFLCFSNKGAVINLTQYTNDDLKVDINFKFDRSELLEARDLYVENERKQLKIVKKNGKNRYRITLKKRLRGLSSMSVSSLQLVRYEGRSRRNWTDKFKNIDCRTTYQATK